jgi:hypothetical protein
MKDKNGLLAVTNLVKHFDISGGLLEQLAWENWRIVRRKTTVKALNDVSLTIMPRETWWVKAVAANRPWQEPFWDCIRPTAVKYIIKTTELTT